MILDKYFLDFHKTALSENSKVSCKVKPGSMHAALQRRRRSHNVHFNNSNHFSQAKCDELLKNWTSSRQACLPVISSKRLASLRDSVAQLVERVSAASAVPPNNLHLKTILVSKAWLKSARLLSTAWATFAVFIRSATSWGVVHIDAGSYPA